jgi:hypothetical protein
LKRAYFVTCVMIIFIFSHLSFFISLHGTVTTIPIEANLQISVMRIHVMLVIAAALVLRMCFLVYLASLLSTATAQCVGKM